MCSVQKIFYNFFFVFIMFSFAPLKATNEIPDETTALVSHNCGSFSKIGSDAVHQILGLCQTSEILNVGASCKSFCKLTDIYLSLRPLGRDVKTLNCGNLSLLMQNRIPFQTISLKEMPQPKVLFPGIFDDLETIHPVLDLHNTTLKSLTLYAEKPQLATELIMQLTSLKGLTELSLRVSVSISLQEIGLRDILKPKTPDISPIFKLTTLKKLSLINFKFSTETLNNLSMSLTLEDLNLDLCGITNSSFLTNMTNLQSLSLTNNPLTGYENISEIDKPLEIHHLKSLQHLTNLTKLDISPRVLSASAFETLLTWLPNLHEVIKK